MDLKRCEMTWNGLIRLRIRSDGKVSAAMNLWIPKKRGIFN
jgi:hypothetical protein